MSLVGFFVELNHDGCGSTVTPQVGGGAGIGIRSDEVRDEAHDKVGKAVEEESLREPVTSADGVPPLTQELAGRRRVVLGYRFRDTGQSAAKRKADKLLNELKRDVEREFGNSDAT